MNFTEKDVVRHDMVTRIVKAYNKRDRKLTDFKNNNETEDNKASESE